MKKIIFLVILVLLVGSVAVNPERALSTALNSYLRLYGVKFRQIKTDSFSVGCYYSDGGHDKTVVLLHGLGGKAASTWFRVMPALAGQFNVIAPDLLLANLVEDNTVNYDLDTDVALVTQLLDELKVEKASIAGLSVGGWIASKVALARPELVESLVLIDSAGLDTEYLLETLGRHGDDFGKWFYENIFYPNPPVPSFLVGPVLDDMDKLGPLCDAFLKNNLYKNESLETQLHKIKCPTLILWGKEDRIIPVKLAYKFNRLIEGSCLKILEDCGHAVVWDKGGELPSILSGFVSSDGANCLGRE